jgi:transcriptional regulator with XRE-family HTH domain
MPARKRFPVALISAIKQHARGSQTEVAEKAGLTPATISRLCAGSRDVTRETLEKIVRVFPENERRRLYLSAIRDFLPEEARELFFPDQNETPVVLRDDETPYHPLDEQTQQFLDWLCLDARRNPETRSWLLTLSRWIAPGSNGH